MKKNIILIDDKASIAKIVAVYLRTEYNLSYYENPVQTLSALEEASTLPDLIICDIHMPAMKGDTFLRRMKATDRYQHIPIIILSSEDSTSERIKLLEEGAVDFILKPFNPMELKVRVKKALSHL